MVAHLLYIHFLYRFHLEMDGNFILFLTLFFLVSRSDKLESQPFDFQEDLLCNYDGELRVNIIQLDTMTLEALQQM